MRLAASLNANRADIQWLQDEFYVERQKAAQRASLTYAIGPLVAGAIYFLLGLTSPRSVSIPVWIFLSFILVPICAGYAVGRQYSPERPPKVRFWAGMWSVGSAMFCYTAISLALIRGRIGQPDPSGQVFLVGLFASTLYMLLLPDRLPQLVQSYRINGIHMNREQTHEYSLAT